MPGVDANSDRPVVLAVLNAALGHCVDDFHCRHHRIYRMGRIAFRQSPGAHITVAYGFQLFQAVARGDLVKGAEIFMQHLDQIFCRHLFGEGREIDKIGKNNGHIFQIF